MHPSRLIILFFSLTGIAAGFLPWVSQSLLGEVSLLKGTDPGYSVTKANVGDGWLTIICFFLILLFVVTGKRKFVPTRRKNVWVALFAVVSLLIALFDLLTIIKKPKTNTPDLLEMKVAPAVGLHLTIIISILLVIQMFFYKTERQSPSTKIG